MNAQDRYELLCIGGFVIALPFMWAFWIWVLWLLLA